MIRHLLCAAGAIVFLPPLVLAQQRESADPATSSAKPAAGETDKKLSAGTLSGLKLRSLGPAITSGRVGDIAVDPADRSHWYVVACSGGVWETHNCGQTWRPIFDRQKSYSVGCITIDPNDPRTLWVGTGENNSQRSVSYGDGVYKSTDGGKSWKNVGLPESEHIGKIVVDPRDSQRVLVAAQGPLWRSGGDRGLHVTEDGGKTWRVLLEIDAHTGISDLVMDPGNPDVMLAAAYQRRRHVFTLINGGPSSGLRRTTDGGETWQKVTSGLPGGDLGRIGLAMSPSRPDVVYAIVEARADKGGCFRSTDGGITWHKRSSYVSRSPQYYQELFVDPGDHDRVYSMDTYMQVSDDGAKSWHKVGEADKHVDNHALWIDPADTRHLLAGCDGGVYETFDRGDNWQFKANLPITQFYRVSADNDFPFYNVYGGTQDNSSLGGPSRTTSANGITNREWFITVGGDGFETVVDPQDPDVVYSQYQYGGLVRYDRVSGESIDIKPRAGADDEPLHWNWNAPLLISPHLHTRLYFAANYLFRSDDRGDSWQRVSGNLTRQLDRNELDVMDRVWSVDAVSKNRSTSVFGNIVALSESPVQEGRLYAGTDDGLIQASVNGGDTWTEIAGVDGVPDMTYVSDLKASLHDPGRVFAAFDNHKRGDFKPYLFRSDDGGATWGSIAGDLPARGSVHTVVEDHVDRDLLFCGTEFGVFFSSDAGATWVQLKGGMPPIAVRDLEIQRRESDLVVGTFGRGIFILDDYSLLRGLNEESFAPAATLFPVKKTWQFVQRRPLGRSGKGFQGASFFTAPNPPVGAVFSYYLADGFKTLKELRRVAERDAAKDGEPVHYPSWDELRAEDNQRDPQVLLIVRDASGDVVRRVPGSKSKGLHRTTWDLRYGVARGRGPMVAPGRFSVTVAVLRDGVLENLAPPQEFEVAPLPGVKFPSRDRDSMLSYQWRAVELQQAVSAAVRAAGDIAGRLDVADKALLALPTVAPAWLADAHALRQRLLRVQIELNGDATISARSEAQLPSIAARVRTAMGGFGTTNETTATHRKSYDIAAAAFERLLPVMAQLQQDLEELEQRIEGAGGPTPAGELPRWRRH